MGAWEQVGQPFSGSLRLIVVVYAARDKVAAIGKHLGQKNLWLTNPSPAMNVAVEIVNPHTKAPPQTQPTTSGSSRSSTVRIYDRTAEEIRNDVMTMFGASQQNEDLPEMEPDACVRTPLLKHQKQALYFLTDREAIHDIQEKGKDNRSVWTFRITSGGVKMYYNVITGHEFKKHPDPVRGGILADMMGLGKTLQILALIAATKTDAASFGQRGLRRQPNASGPVLIRNAKTTLLIAPMSTISNWEDQINAHIEPDTFSWYIYHGNRIQDLNRLADYDIVITTYGTVRSEFKKGNNSTLHKLQWFRIVLDEAHTIRGDQGQQTKAVFALSAQRRWAVTGTPVQNRLEDLGSLIRFLRVAPFDEPAGFKQFILAPFRSADPEIVTKLQLLVNSFTLRRLKDRIDLPQRNDSTVGLDFSVNEQKIYDTFAKDAAQQVNAATRSVEAEGGKLRGRSYATILRHILKLRLICAHGQELLSEEDLDLFKGATTDNAIELDEDADPQRPALTANQAYDMLILLRESDSHRCAKCKTRVAPTDSSSDDESDDESDEVQKNRIFGYMLSCYQILCPKCYPAT